MSQTHPHKCIIFDYNIVKRSPSEGNSGSEDHNMFAYNKSEIF
jgi:hypothetical protein